MTRMAQAITTASAFRVGVRRATGNRALRRAKGQRLYSGNEEPLLSEVLLDPIIQCLMRRDGVRMSALVLLVTDIQRRFR